MTESNTFIKMPKAPSTLEKQSEIKTVHFVYPYGPQISTPNAIGREVGLRLRQHYEVIQYNWDEVGQLQPSADAVLLGHAHPSPETIFRQSAQRKGWGRVLLMQPFQHADLFQIAFIPQVVPQSDLFLAITGNYWFETLPQSVVSYWAPKMVHMDLAVNRAHFPPSKPHFNPPGKRRFVYIGYTPKYKNLPWLNTIAKALPEYEFAWIGRKDRDFDGIKHLGHHDFATEAGREVVAQHDFLITVGNADANPTTILEAMAWGLIPVCTMQSGYRGYAGIVNVPLNDTEGTVKILRELQELPEEQLHEWQAINWQALDNYFNWDRFTHQILDAIQSGESPAIGHESLIVKGKFKASEARLSLSIQLYKMKMFRMLFYKFMGMNHPFAKWAKGVLGYGNQK